LLERVPSLVRKGGFSASESYAWHRKLLETKRDSYDPFVIKRILRGTEQTAIDYIDLLAARRAAITEYESVMQSFDALVMPTTPVIAPRFSEVEAEEEATRINLLILRNTLLINLFDGCSISLPMHVPGSAPTGLMLSAPAMADHRLFDIAAAVESTLASG
jgi:aspartyl-tRNA(Asn)/glutamyl-tRNA(Gln) amidotransferase subunit A